MDERIYKGDWIVDKLLNDKFSGTLCISNEKIELEVIGECSKHLIQIPEINFITGITSDGYPITLFKNHCFSENISYKHLTTNKFTCHSAFIGHHFKNLQELRFCECDIIFDGIDLWLNEFGIQKLEIPQGDIALELTYVLPRKIKFDINDHIKGEFSFRVNFPMNKNSSHFELIQTSITTLNFKAGNISLIDLNYQIKKFQSFLSLAYYGVPNIKSIILYNSDLTESYFENEIQKKPIEFISIDYRLYTNFKMYSKHDYLFTFKEIEPSFEITINKWYSLFEKIQPVVGTLTENLKSKSTLLELKFLDLMHALEVFHRRLMENKNLNSIEHKKKINEILNSVNEKHRNWLKERLNYSFEPSLQNRLEELIDELPSEIINLIITDIKSFIKNIKNSRHYYTHYNKKLEKKAIKGKELYPFTERLKVILVALMLKELKVFGEKFSDIFIKKANYHFGHIFSGRTAK